jgi:hypothetical protein
MSGGDETFELIRRFSDRHSEAASRLDALLDLRQVDDPRLTSAVLRALLDAAEMVSIRVGALRYLRDRLRTTERRAEIANALMRVVGDAGSDQRDLRVQVSLALGDCTDVPGVVTRLGAICASVDEVFEVRYAAFTSVERSGPTAEAVEILRQLCVDETLGRSAEGMLRRWRVR